MHLIYIPVIALGLYSVGYTIFQIARLHTYTSAELFKLAKSYMIGFMILSSFAIISMVLSVVKGG